MILMKMRTIIVTVVLGLAAQAVALDPTSGPSASAKLPNAKLFQWAKPLAQTQAPDKLKIERFGGMSSEPWTKIVGWHPGEPSAFMDLRGNESGWPLPWFGAEP